MSTNAEKLEVIMRSRLTVRDICILMDCGFPKAKQYVEEFKKWYEEEYPDSPWFGVPTNLFTKLFNIDENRIIRNVEIEKRVR